MRNQEPPVDSPQDPGPGDEKRVTPTSPDYRDASSKDRLSADLEIFKLVVGHFQHDLRMFWQHAGFFLLIEGALLTLFLALKDSGSTPPPNADPGPPLIPIFAGWLVSVFWYLVARFRLRLIEMWRLEVIRFDKRLDLYGSYKRIEEEVQRNRLRTPTHLTQYVPLLILAGWIALLWS